MKKYALVALAASMMISGTVFTMQGLGYVKGSPMTNVDMWAVLGPILAGLGVALLLVALRGKPAGRR